MLNISANVYAKCMLNVYADIYVLCMFNVLPDISATYMLVRQSVSILNFHLKCSQHLYTLLNITSNLNNWWSIVLAGTDVAV